jgi:drug/metabolite transporter (DMT)-like permease
MLLGSLAFAVMGALAHDLGPRCGWLVVVLARAGLVLVFAAAVAGLAGVNPFLWKPRTLWLRSIAGSISMFCTFYALNKLPIAHVFTLTNMFPIWVTLLSWPLFGERPTGLVWFSVVCAVVGVALIQQPNFSEGNFAALAALAGSLATAVAMIGLHRLHGIDARAIIVHFSGVALMFCIVALVISEPVAATTSVLDVTTLLMLLGVGVTATIGQFFLTKAFTYAQPSKVSVVGLTQIVFAFGLDYWQGYRSIDSTVLLGMGMVIAPTAWLMANRG